MKWILYDNGWNITKPFPIKIRQIDNWNIMTFLKLFHFSQGKYIWKPKYIIQITGTDWVFSSLKCRQSHCPWAFSSWNRDIQHKLGQCPGCWHPGFLWTSAKASATMIWSMRVKRILHEEVFQLHASCYCYHWILWQSNCRVTWLGTIFHCGVISTIGNQQNAVSIFIWVKYLY